MQSPGCAGLVVWTVMASVKAGNSGENATGPFTNLPHGTVTFILGTALEFHICTNVFCSALFAER